MIKPREIDPHVICPSEGSCSVWDAAGPAASQIPIESCQNNPSRAIRLLARLSDFQSN